MLAAARAIPELAKRPLAVQLRETGEERLNKPSIAHRRTRKEGLEGLIFDTEAQTET